MLLSTRQPESCDSTPAAPSLQIVGYATKTDHSLRTDAVRGLRTWLRVTDILVVPGCESSHAEAAEIKLYRFSE